MDIAVARGNWHGFSLEDLFLGIAGVIFAVVLAWLFGVGRGQLNGAGPIGVLPGDESGEHLSEPPTAPR
ncbi:MAG: hypothetical protein IT336_00285 [Thermomicrobiales bacterium]|nr:hypothetical protein [Thermomicrobiales bacterium]